VSRRFRMSSGGGFKLCMWALAGVLALDAAGWAKDEGSMEGGPASRPAAAVRGGDGAGGLESIQIARTSGRGPAEAKSSAGTTGLFSAWRVLGAMVVVLAAIFGVRWYGRRFLGLAGARSTSGAIQVLCRSALSPKQQLMLVQVGRRVVLVADCGVQMSALCEISDPEEVAALAGQIQQRKGDSASSSFRSVLGREGAQFRDGQSEEEEAGVKGGSVEGDEASLATTRAELSGLLAKVRGLTRLFGRA